MYTRAVQEVLKSVSGTSYIVGRKDPNQTNKTIRTKKICLSNPTIKTRAVGLVIPSANSSSQLCLYPFIEAIPDGITEKLLQTSSRGIVLPSCVVSFSFSFIFCCYTQTYVMAGLHKKTFKEICFLVAHRVH